MRVKFKNIAYLGPVGTNTELALNEFVAYESSLPCFSVPEVFQAVATNKVDAGFVPIENLIQGIVTETLDSLRLHQNQVYIGQSHLMPIRNALGVLSEAQCGKAWPREIKYIRSHEQPLNQCSKYLAEHFSNAERITAPSTAAAIQHALQHKLADTAVIAPKESLQSLGLQVLAEDISNFPDNKTRFVLLQAGNIQQLLEKQALAEKPDSADDSFVTSVILDPKRDRQGLLFEVLRVISIEHQINLVTLHSRPDSKGGFVFYFDLEGHPRDPKIERCLQALRQFCLDSTGETVEISVLGYYPRKAFYGLPFRTIGIVGGDGKMGRWLSEFFGGLGLQVLSADRSSKLTIKDLLAKSDVIILSVPMHSAKAVASEILPHLRPQQLIVENCSVKSCVLPFLEESAPAGVEVLGIHTMFGGDIQQLRGENVIITRTHRAGTKAKALEDLLYKYGAKLNYSSVSEHDHASAALQSLVQLDLIAMADTLAGEFPTSNAVEVFTTPNSRVLFQAMGRVLNQSDELIVDLQTQNSDAVRVRHRFLSSLVEIISGLNHGDLSPLRNAVQRGKKFFGA